ncbi:MAG: amidohydrolase family protein, partial [bacterium]
MKYDLKIENGTLYTGQEIREADIGIEGETIKKIEPDLPGEARRTIDASDRQVLPGAIDPHVHFNLELPLLGITSRDDYITGARAAARGGLTMVIDYSEQQEDEKIIDSIERKVKEEMEDKSCIDYSVHGCVYHWSEQIVDELDELVARGFPTLKMFMIYSEEGWRAEEPALLQAMERAGETGATICVHCENDDLLQYFTEKEAKNSKPGDAHALARSRPNIVEASAIRRAIELCEYAEGRLYVVHTSTGEGAEAIRQAHRRGVQVFG